VPSNLKVNLNFFEGDRMNHNNDRELKQLQVKVQAMTADIRALANSYEGNSLALLSLLRALEDLHRNIRDNLFQASLPDNRQALHALLRDMEEVGGWPYIERMRLRSLLSNFTEADVRTTDAQSEK
jgi:hypothetical protein